MGHRPQFSGQGLLGRGPGGEPVDAGRRQNYRHHLCSGWQIWELAALGGYGVGESRHGVAVPLLRGSSRKTANHGERH